MPYSRFSPAYAALPPFPYRQVPYGVTFPGPTITAVGAFSPAAKAAMLVWGGLLAGGLIGNAIAKNRRKDEVTGALLGAAVGGFAGVGVAKIAQID